MSNSFGNVITSSASLRTEDKQKALHKEYIFNRIIECINIDKLELSKRAIDAGSVARTAIDKTVARFETELRAYVNEHIEEIVDNKYELLHISELENLSTQIAYQRGHIVAEIQRVVIFSRK